MGYGAPIGFIIAADNPERVTGLIIQKGNAYDESLRDFWKDKTPDNTKEL